MASETVPITPVVSTSCSPEKREKESSNVSNVYARLSVPKAKTSFIDSNLTFQPKLNHLSLQLARRRSERMEEYQEKLQTASDLQMQKHYAQCTFKPIVSEKSAKLAIKLGSTFLSRQQLYMEKRQQLASEGDNLVKKRSKIVRSTALSTKNSKTITLVSQRHDACEGSVLRCQSVMATYAKSDDTAGSREDAVKLPECVTSLSVTGQGAHKCQSENSHSPKLLKRPKSVQSRSSGNQCVCGRTTAQRTSELQVCHQRHHTSPGCLDNPKRKTFKFHLQKRSNTLETAKPLSNLNKSYSKLKSVRQKADEIMKSKRIFIVRGPYKVVRRGLRSRGWVEKDHHRKVDPKADRTVLETEEDSDADLSSPEEESSDEEYSDEEEYTMLSRAVRNSIPYFIWTVRRDPDLYTCLRKDQMVNHIKGTASFTTKVGLCTNLEEALWLGDVNINTFFPRCYKLGSDEQKDWFEEDYHLTAASSVVKMIVEGYKGHSGSAASSVTVTDRDVGLALTACQVYLNTLDHDDIESSSTWLVRPLGVPEWGAVRNMYRALLHSNAKLVCGTETLERCQDMYRSLKARLPQFVMEGVHNIWIVKPGALSRGRGIYCCTNLDEILDLVSSPTQKKEGKWIVQKYIERPLLVYNTKFDIRQWFLVTEWNPLTMWMYRSSYLRFSSNPYSLEDLDCSIHLCNNSIQKDTNNSNTRDPRLPHDNMWDHRKFINHLCTKGQDGHKLWEESIYPAMRDAIIHVLQAVHEIIEPQPSHTFELFGADFMVTQDFKTWLIEVNSSPSMAYSTPITKKLCRAVLEDTLKVVLDRRSDKTCFTGDFELAYKQPKFDQSNYFGVQLCVEGTGIPKGKQTRATK